VERIDVLIRDTNSLHSELRTLVDAGGQRETRITVLEKARAMDCEKINGLESRVNTWGGLNTIFAAIAGVVGYLGINK